MDLSSSCLTILCLIGKACGYQQPCEWNLSRKSTTATDMTCSFSIRMCWMHASILLLLSVILAPQGFRFDYKQ